MLVSIKGATQLVGTGTFVLEMESSATVYEDHAF